MTGNDGTVLVVGYTVPMQKALEGFLPEGSVVFVDEPDVARKREALPKIAGSPVVRELIQWEYQLPAAADRFYHRHRHLRPAAVIPGLEYAVPFAARLAERFGVPGAGTGAAAILRDKHLLRLVSAEAGIDNPRSFPVTGPDDVRARMAQLDGPVVLKPTNRQASVGTVIIDDPADVPSAWAAAIVQDEGIMVPDRPVPLRMIVEEYVRGEEFSVEMVFRDGEPLFGNVTGKVLYPGPRPIELGHTVPADIPAALTERLLDATHRVIDAVGFGTGFVHCEWIVADDRPYLVECAGRMPGDGIIELIEHAWPTDIVRYYVTVMQGVEPAERPPRTAAAGAAVWFLHPEPGEVVAVEGLEEVRGLPGVITAAVVVGPGDRVHELRSSWDRVGIVTAKADTAAEALERAQDAIGRLSVKVTSA